MRRVSVQGNENALDIHFPILDPDAFQGFQIIEDSQAEGSCDIAGIAQGMIAAPYTIRKANRERTQIIVTFVKYFRRVN